jgi:alpha-L-glutamate ligase-like protein
MIRTLLSRRFWAWPGELHRGGILGINGRNGEFILPNNPRARYPRVDEKHRTKQICQERRIPVPETYALIERHGDVFKFLELIEGREDFVIKPAAGSAGRGITVVARHDGEQFFTSSGDRYLLADMTYHLAAILSGLYSLAGQPDFAIVEQRIMPHAIFENVTVSGTPDIRVVLYRCVPVMAMVRLPTRASRGRANLHQGAAGAGVDLRSGLTFGGVCMDRAVTHHPDTGQAIAGLEIPFWNDLLAAAMKLADGLELGYIGVDFVVDAAVGPVVLEANARPGLNIQVANRRGLRPRLAYLDAQPTARLAPERRGELIEELAGL